MTRKNELKNMEINEAIAKEARNLINFVIKKYEIKNADEFTCPIHKKLAKLISNKYKLKYISGGG